MQEKNATENVFCPGQMTFETASNHRWAQISYSLAQCIIGQKAVFQVSIFRL